MATFVKRGNRWRAVVRRRGTQESKTFATKREAQRWAMAREDELDVLASTGGGGVTTPNKTMADLFVRYAEEISDAKKGARWETIRLQKLGRDPLASNKLSELKRENFEDFVRRRLKEVMASSVNRELNLISHTLTQARRWRWMDENHKPLSDLERPKNPEPRDRRIDGDEIQRILHCLNYSERDAIVQQKQRVAVAFLLALETAMRAGEICALQAHNVDLENCTALLEDTKNGTQREVPLSPEAVRLLRRLEPWPETHRTRGKTESGSIFPLRSGTLSTLFKQAVLSANIDNLTFHDTRHEAITRLADKLEVLDLARMVGHKNIKQLMTYYNKKASDIATLLR